MTELIRGPVVLMGQGVDTDQIIPARYLTSSDPAELAAHAFEDHPLRDRIKPGVIIVAGHNFGSGSSREHAPLALLGAGVQAVLAESLARIFSRNAINIGLLALEVPGVSAAADGTEVSLDLAAGRLTGVDGLSLAIPPVPPFINEIIAAGGLIDWVKAGGLARG